MKRPRVRYFDLSKVIIGAVEKPSQTGRRAPDVRVPVKNRYRGQCATCGGSGWVPSPAGVQADRWPCPYCTGYQKCGL
jgi:hypothetical protein